MRPLTIAGIIITLLGAVVLLWGGRFTSKRDVLTVGDLKVTASEQRTIPPWVGGLAVIAGVGLVVAGVRKRA
jgi:drug/metabolite transporter (DMT)-like permease